MCYGKNRLRARDNLLCHLHLLLRSSISGGSGNRRAGHAEFRGAALVTSIADAIMFCDVRCRVLSIPFRDR